MSTDVTESATETEKAAKAPEFQSPPKLSEEISPEEQAAIHGPALHHAKNLSHTAAIIAGTLGAGLSSLALSARSPNQALTVMTSTIAGGVIGYAISDLPWNEKPKPVTPKPHAAAAEKETPPAPAVATAEHAGRVEAASPTLERSA